MGLFKKKYISEYDMLERIKCDLESALQNPNPGYSEYCKLIAESQDYLFYSYKSYSDNSGGYVIRRSKANPKETVFFGQNYQFSCIFEDHLFQCAHMGERGRFFVIAKNIVTGHITTYDWFGKGDIIKVIGGYDKVFVQDTVNSLFIQDNTLIFDITRKKAATSDNSDKYNVDTKYLLKVTFENGHFKPVAYFNISTKEQPKSDTTEHNKPLDKTVHPNKKSSLPSGLGKDEEKHISCKYEGHEDDCPNDCEKCAISIKTDGDIAFSNGDIEKAIKQYKRAVFVEPKFATAWANMGNAYGMKLEYNNALAAFDKAISIDPKYGKALFGKAITLKNLGKLGEAMEIANHILELYDDDDVKKFKVNLIKAGVKDKSLVVDTEKAKAALFGKAGEVMRNNNLLDKEGTVEVISDIYQPEEFTKKVLDYCKRRYASLGADKVYGECVITSFYGSICAVLFYQKDPKGIANKDIFDYLNNNTNIESIDESAERLLGTKAGEEKAESIWNIFSPYLSLSQAVFKTVDELTDDILLKAMEHAYVLGMLVAKYYTSNKVKKHMLGTRAEIDQALKKLAESSKDYQNPPPESAMCYSPRVPDEVMASFRCSMCGKTFTMRIYEGSEALVDHYKELASQFCELGHKADIMCLCDECADRYFPSRSSWDKHHIVFSFTAKGSSKAVYSYPATWKYNDFEYQIALSFLRGSTSIKELSADTNSTLDASKYLENVRNIIGDGAK